MEKVQNKKTLNRISKRIVKSRGKKNLVTIIAIMLTTILFTALFTVGGAMINSLQESTMRQVGGKSMAGVKFILPEDYEKLSSDSKVKNSSYRILVGQLINEKLTKLSTEISYAEDENAKEMFCYPEVGNMPKERSEIATSTLVLDALRIPHELGTEVTLEILVDDKIVTENFTLTGYWTGDSVAAAQQCWTSKEFCLQVAPTSKTPFHEQKEIKYAGYWMMDFDFSNSWDIENKTIDLLERNGYDTNQVAYGVNWAYTTSNVDGSLIGFVVVLLGVILASGYLIIYNIFSLNVTSDIKSYGLLKTIGTTEEQLKTLVRKQAGFLSLIGIPCGLILGVMLGKCIFPMIIGFVDVNQGMEFSVSPWFLIGSTIFSVLTVWISCNKPCKIAANVSPIEAVKYIDNVSLLNQKERKARKVTVFSFAWENIRRNRKKVVVVVASLSLSMILLNSIYTLIKGFDMDKYVSNFIIEDGIVTDASVLNFSPNGTILSAVTKEIQEELWMMEEIEEIHNVYLAEAQEIQISNTAKEEFISFTEEKKEFFSDPYCQNELNTVKESNIFWGSLYGLDNWGMEQLEYHQGTMDWEKFKTGNYCVINSYGSAWELEDALTGLYCKVGDKVSIGLSDGTIKEYEVMAIASIPHAMSGRFHTMLGMEIVIPETEYLAHAKEEGAMLSVLIEKKDNVGVLDKKLKSYTEGNRSNLDYVSKADYEDEFKEYVNSLWIVGGALSLILALIGILNFVNVVVTGIIARKQELAMMEAVGMTGKQMKSMLAWKGILYILFTIIASVVLGKVIDILVMENAFSDMWYFTNEFTIVPIMLCIPFLIIIAYIVPVIAYKNMKQESVVERLRQVD